MSVATQAIPVVETPVVDEAIWNAWIQLGRKREKAIDRKMKIFVIALAVVGAGCYAVFFRLAQ